MHHDCCNVGITQRVELRGTNGYHVITVGNDIQEYKDRLNIKQNFLNRVEH